MKTAHTIAIAIIAGALLAPTLSAHAQKIDVSIGSSTRQMTSGSIDALSNDRRHSAFSMGIGYNLEGIRVAMFEVDAFANFEAGESTGTTFQTMETNLTTVGGMVGARLRWRVPLVDLFGRVGVGMTRVGLDLQEASSDRSHVSDAGTSATTYIGGGFEMLPLRSIRNGKRRFAAGFRVEGGFLAATSVTMRAVPRDENSAMDAIRIPTTNASLGSVNPSAWSARFALVARF